MKEGIFTDTDCTLRRTGASQALPFVVASLLVSVFSVCNAGATAPVLAAQGIIAGQFQFVLTGESNVTYTIETSTDLVAWASIGMSAGSNSQRLVSIPATNSEAYFRARVSKPIFAAALTARAQIDLLGNNIRTDSFDSTDPSHSTGGAYDASKANDHGDVVTASSIINSIGVGNADIYGHVSTGPGGTVAIGPLGSVGDNAWHAANNRGVEPGYITHDATFDFPDVRIPFTGGYIPYIPTNGLGNGNYQTATFTMTNGTLLVTGNAVVYVTGDLTLGGTASIQITPGSSLRLYVGGLGEIADNAIVNDNDASHFIYYGLPTATSVTLSRNLLFVGCIYAPNADLTLGSVDNNFHDFSGACVTKTVSVAGHFNFHFDESLKKVGPLY